MADDIDSPEWETDPELWESVGLGGEFLPGICTVEDAKASSRIDKRKPRGRHGARLVGTGDNIAEFRITMTIWTREQHEAWKDLFPKINPRRANAGDAIDIVHAGLAEIGITSVYIKSVSALVPGGFHGSRTATIQVIEHTDSSSSNRRRRNATRPVNNSNSQLPDAVFDPFIGRSQSANSAESRSPMASGAADP
jgi:hypothetical protein